MSDISSWNSICVPNVHVMRQYDQRCVAAQWCVQNHKQTVTILMQTLSVWKVGSFSRVSLSFCRFHNTQQFYNFTSNITVRHFQHIYTYKSNVAKNILLNPSKYCILNIYKIYTYIKYYRKISNNDKIYKFKYCEWAHKNQSNFKRIWNANERDAQPLL